MTGSKIVIQAKAPSGQYVDVASDASGNIGGGGGGGGGGSVTISDGVSTATITDVSGKQSLDVNVTNIAISANDDSIAIKSPTTGYSIEPNQDGSIKATELEGLIQVLNSLTMALMRNQPQMDINQRPLIRVEALASNLTLTNLTNLQNISGGNASGIPYHLGAAPLHIYDKIVTS